MTGPSRPQRFKFVGPVPPPLEPDESYLPAAPVPAARVIRIAPSATQATPPRTLWLLAGGAALLAFLAWRGR